MVIFNLQPNGEDRRLVCTEQWANQIDVFMHETVSFRSENTERKHLQRVWYPVAQRNRQQANGCQVVKPTAWGGKCSEESISVKKGC